MTTPRRTRRNISENVRVLHNALTNILNDEDRAYFIRSLNQYQKDRDVIELVDSLKRILDTPRKREVYPLLRDIIPSSDKRYFEKTWHASQGQSLTNLSKEWSTNSTARSRSQSRPLEPLRRSNYHCSLPENLDKYDSGIDIPNLKNGTTSRSPQKYPIRRLYIKRSQGTGFGFSMRGGSEHGVGLYVSSVDENSLAEYEGLLPGDHILSVNDIQFDGLSHDQAVKIIRNNKKLSMVVRSVGRIPNTFIAEATYKWIDPSGQRVSPPPNVDSNGREMSTDGIHRSDLRLLGDDDERKVNIFVEDGVKLGLKIRGGSEYGLGIYIAGVDPKSAADRAGLKVGDQIMDVNGVSFLNISHAHAVKVLKSAKNMMVTMKDVGRLPFAKTTTDKTNWAKGKLPKTTVQSDTESINTTVQIHAPPTTLDDRRNTTAGTTTRFERRPEDSKFRQSIAGSQLMYNGTGPSTKSLTEEQARQVLNENEFGTMSYYLEEYRRGFIAVDALVLALFSLFNSPAKLSLLTEVRGFIVPKDIDRFDELVLKKEIDAMKSRKVGPSSHEDAQSIHSYSSSISSYSGRSSSSRSSTRDSHGADSRPITPPRVPEILPSNLRGDVRGNKINKRETSHDKTLTNDTENGLGSCGLGSPNDSFNDSQEATLELSGMIPLSSSSPRNAKSMTNGEITKYLIIGDNDRNEDTMIEKKKSKRSNSPRSESSKSHSKKEQVKEETSSLKTLSTELPAEAAKKEKRAFSLFPHSKFKGSYSPNKHFSDHPITNSEVLCGSKSSNDKSLGNKKSSSGDAEIVNDVDLGVSQEMRNLEKRRKKNSYENVVERKGPSTLNGNEKVKSKTDESMSTGVSSYQKHQPKPEHSLPNSKDFDSVHLEGQRVNIVPKISPSAFAPPKPPRSFHLSEGYAAIKDNLQENSGKAKENGISSSDVVSKKDNSDKITGAKEGISSITPPKPKPYHSYVQEPTVTANISNHLDHGKQDNDYIDIDGINLLVSPPKANSPVLPPGKNVPISQNSVRTQNEYVDIDLKKNALSPPPMPEPYASKTEEKKKQKSVNGIPSGSLQSNDTPQKNSDVKKNALSPPPMPKPYSSKTDAKTEKSINEAPSGSLRSNVTPNENVQVLSFENLEIPKETKRLESSQQQGLGGEHLECVEKKSSVPPPKPPPYNPNHMKGNGDGKFERQAQSGPQLGNTVQKASTAPSKTPPNSQKSEDGRGGMFLAMEATTTNRSGLERSTAWGDESFPSESTSLYSVVSIFPRNPKIVSDSPKIDGNSVKRDQEVPKRSPTEDVSTSVGSQKSNTSDLTIGNYKEIVNDCDAKEVETKVSSKVNSKVITHDENQNETEEIPSGSLVRNMVNTYNHMSDESRPGHKLNSTSQKSSNRKSWDGAHNPGPPNESRKISSLETKRKLKSNSDSNLMNLPKDQQKDIQVKLRASQELLDLRHQAKSRESSTNNSPRHSMDGSQHPTLQLKPTSDADSLVRSQHGSGYEIVQIEKTHKGLGLTLEGGSVTSSMTTPVKIKGVKEGPYAAYQSGKLRPGQELVQINDTPVKGMTNVLAVLALRQTYADPEHSTFTLVVKDP